MKITVEHIDTGENEVILRCASLDEDMLRVLSLLRSEVQKLCAWDEKREVHLLSPGEIIFAETLEDKTFLYTKTAIYQTALGLGELEGRYGELGLVRVGKSTVLNLHHIQSLRSYGAGRIEATLETQERVVISRHYAPLLKERLGLKGV